MLKGLDDIDWTRYSTWNGESVRNLVQRLAEGDLDAMAALFPDYFLGGFAIPKWMPDVIPFIIQILDSDQLIANFARTEYSGVEELFYPLRETATESRTSFYYRVGPIDYRGMDYVKLCVRTYDALTDGLTVYLKFLSNPDEKVRLHVVDFLTGLLDSAKVVADAFQSRIQTESSLSVKIKLIDSLGKLISDAHIFQTDEDRLLYLDFLVNLLHSETEEIVTFYTAMSSAKVAHIKLWLEESIPIDPLIISTLHQFLISEMPIYGSSIGSEIPTYYKNNIVEALGKIGQEQLLQMLNAPELSPVDIHLVVRELLNQVFHRIKRTTGTEQFFLGFHVHLRSSLDKTKGSPPNLIRYDQMPGLFPESITILKGVVDCDRFWEIPTNLLSALFDLPDSRDELRKLIAES